MAIEASDVRGLRFIRPDGRFNLSVIMVTAHRICAQRAADPFYRRLDPDRRSRFRGALQEAWRLAKVDQAMMRARQAARAETARLDSLSPPERELACIEADLFGATMSDMPARALVAEVAALNARAAAIRSTVAIVH